MAGGKKSLEISRPDKELQAINDCSLLIVYVIPSGPTETINTQIACTQTKYTQQVVFVHMHTCAHYICNNDNQGKRDCHFESK